MKTLNELLSMNPLKAIKEIMLDRLQIRAEEHWFTIRAISGRYDNSVGTLYLELNNLECPPLLSSQFKGDLVYYFEKLNLNKLNSKGTITLPLNSLSMNLPIHEIMEQYYITKGVRFIPEDFSTTTITRNLTKLRAGNSSTRWYGELDVIVKVADEPILDYVKNNKLPTPFDNTIGVSTILDYFTKTLNSDNKSTLPVPLRNNSYSLQANTVTRIGNDGDALNTSIVLRLMMDYSGDLTVHYTRRSFGETFSNPLLFVNKGNLTKQDIVDGINQRKKSNITLNDLVPFDIPSNEKWTKQKFYVRFKETSLLYTGEIWLEHKNGDYL